MIFNTIMEWLRKTQTRLRTHKLHPISHTIRQATGCPSRVFGQYCRPHNGSALYVEGLLAKRWTDDCLITWTLDILSLWSLTWNRNKCPGFCTFPLEFGGVSDLHTHQNRRLVCQNHNNLSIKTTVLPRLCKHGKHVYEFHPYKSVRYISHAEHFISN